MKIRTLAELADLAEMSLDQLKRSDSLNLFAKSIEALPDSIGELQALTRLYLGENQLHTLPDSFGNLQALTLLYLDGNQLHTLPDSFGNLQALTLLYLRGNQLHTLPESFGNLQALTELYLDGNQLHTLPDSFGDLQALTRLYLGENQLHTLPENFGDLQALTLLYLDGNQLHTLPDSFGDLQALTELYLGANQLHTLPDSFGDLQALTELDLRENQLPIPPEILDNPNNPDRIINYFLDLQASPEPKKLNEVKLILVGQGGVGKTSLVNRVVHQRYDEHSAKTEGIHITRWLLEHNKERIHANIWDFGGQEIMHSTHQFFLTKRSVYILVIDARQGESASRIEYWLKMIEGFGDNSPAIIAVNKTDEHPLEFNRSGLKNKYPFLLDFFDISCKTGAGSADLRKFLIEHISKLPHVNDVLPDPWFAVKKRLSESDRDYVPYAEYANICREHNISDTQSQESLGELLHDLGIIINFNKDSRLRETNVLNPKWVTNGVYAIINSNALFQAKGVLSIGELAGILDTKTYPGDTHIFLMELMEKFELCFRFEGMNADYLIPELLQKEEPALNWNAEESLRFEFHYDILPSSIMSRLIVRLNHLILQKTYWYSGAVFVDEYNRALVRSDEEDKIISIWVIGNQDTRRGFLRLIRGTLGAIHATVPKLNAKEKVPSQDSVIDYKHLCTLEKLGVEDIVPEGQEMRVLVKDLLDGVDSRENQTTVFISYSHKDKQYLERLQIHLLPIVRAENVELWDDTKLRGGDKWEDEIKKALKRTDIAFLLVSADFLASEFIVDNELPPLLKAAKTRGMRILPIILSACLFSESELSAFQALHDPKEPLAQMPKAKREQIYTKAAREVRSIVGEQT